MSKIITTAKGFVEIETIGTGAPVLILHGSPGGLDGARAMSRFLDSSNFKTILVSRPGYLGTPLHLADTSIDHEADLLIALLDALHIPRAGILAWSGGGPSAYRLAARYHERISALVAIAAVSSRWVAPQPKAAQRFLFGTRLGEWMIDLLSRYSQQHVVGGALEGEGSVRGEALRQLIDHTMASPEQRQLILEVSRTVNTSGRRKLGWQNDVSNFSRIRDLELDQIRCPTLIIHGDADTDASLEHSHFAHRQVRHSELIVLENGTHLAFYAHPRAAEVQSQVKVWLARQLAPL